MFSPSEKQAIFRAVFRCFPELNANRKSISHALNDFAGGDVAELMQSFVSKGLLSQVQAKELRAKLPVPSVNGKQAAKPALQAARKEIKAEDDTVQQMSAPQSRPEAITDAEPETGAVFGEFHVLRKLGQGGTCSVFLGYRQSDNQKVAIKVLPAAAALHQETLDRFYREAKSACFLRHNNLVHGIAFGQDRESGFHYLVLEFVDGFSARQLLEKYKRLSVGDAVHIVLEVARGLEHAHSRNFIHRDIKPGNILITRSGVAKLSDMGLAKRTDEPSHLTGTHQGFGTPYYMPYEQAINARHADGRSDIFALGATFYHLLTGKVPFSGKSHLEIVEKKSHGRFRPARSVNHLVPAQLDQIISNMMARKPQDRYQTISEVIVDLERANLAPTIPSFVDEQLAFEDPVVRERLTSAAEATCPDLGLHLGGKLKGAKIQPDLWYFRYRMSDEKWFKARATTTQVIKRLQKKQIPTSVELSRYVDGEYRPLTECTEFQPLLRKLRRRKKKLREKKRLMQNVAAKNNSQITNDGESWKALIRPWHWYAGGSVIAALVAVAALVIYRLFFGA